MRVLTDWFRRYFSDPQVVFLAAFLVVGFAVVLTMGDMLAPVLASIVIAYLLEGLVSFLQRHGWPRLASVTLVYLLFIVFVVAVLIGVVPLILRQVTQLAQQIPDMITKGQKVLMGLPETYPDLISPEQVQQVIGSLRTEMANFGQLVVSWSFASVVDMFTLLVYIFLVPLLVLFFLKDRDLIIEWFKRYLPKHRKIAGTVWRDVDRQISNYMRGKFWEILLVWAVSYATFQAFGLNYAMLLGLLVGLSVIVPFVGAYAVSVPVFLIAWFQLGWTPEFFWLVGAYVLIQAIDGNILVPLLFSEVVNLHPVAIIVAILVFGGLWGFWGVFFAIPLATLVQAILTAWPHHEAPAPPESEPTEGGALS